MSKKNEIGECFYFSGFHYQLSLYGVMDEQERKQDTAYLVITDKVFYTGKADAFWYVEVTD